MRICFRNIREVLAYADLHKISPKHHVHLIGEGMCGLYDEHVDIMESAVKAIERRYRLEKRPRRGEQYCYDIISKYRRDIHLKERLEKDIQHAKERYDVYHPATKVGKNE